MPNTELTFSNIRKASALPPKTRTVQESPLSIQMRRLNKPGQSFLIQNAEISDIAPTAYATARRLGIKVKLRREQEGTAVYLDKPAASN